MTRPRHCCYWILLGRGFEYAFLALQSQLGGRVLNLAAFAVPRMMMRKLQKRLVVSSIRSGARTAGQWKEFESLYNETHKDKADATSCINSIPETAGLSSETEPESGKTDSGSTVRAKNENDASRGGSTVVNVGKEDETAGILLRERKGGSAKAEKAPRLREMNPTCEVSSDARKVMKMTL